MSAPTARLDAPSLRGAFGQIRGGRDYQEDTVGLHADDAVAGSHLALVADGMGGYEGGDVASQAAADAFVGTFREGQGAPAARLEDALASANGAVAAARAAGRGSAEMGCTLLAVWADAEEIAWVSVGDSPLWLWTPGDGLRRLNEDHSMAPVIDRMAESGVISAADAEDDPERHALRSAVTGDDIALVDKGRAAWPEAAALLLASDGLLALSKEAISAELARAGGDPQAAADGLLSAVDALADPHQDNTSAVVLVRGVALAGPAPAQAVDAPPPREVRGRRLLAVALVVLALALVAAGWLWLSMGHR